MIEQQQQDARTWAMLAHLSAFAGIVIPALGNVLGPLIVWLIKKDQYAFVDDQGKESVNFHLTMLIAYVIAGILACAVVGFFILPVVALIDLIFTIIAAAQANQGIAYRYPLTLRLIK